MFSFCDIFLAAAVTPVHVGVGRSPGTVDLPVARDEYGLPYLPASSLKGSVKSICMRIYGQRPWGLCERVYGWDIRVHERAPEEPYVSPVAFTDAVLLLYPVRVEKADGGVEFAYATSGLTLDRICDLIEACEAARCDAEADKLLQESCHPNNRGWCSSDGSKKEDSSSGDSNYIYMNNVPISNEKYCVKRLKGGLVSAIEDMSSRLAKRLLGKENQVYIVEDDALFREVVEAGILRVTRVALDPETKTVRTGALWSEEYISQGAVFLFAVFYRDSGGQAASASEARLRTMRLLRYEAGDYLVVGGKETIGRGLLRLKCLTCGDGGLSRGGEEG